MELYEHQKTALRFSLSRLHTAYLMDVGTGKTRPAILDFYFRKKKKPELKCLITCFASTIYDVWVKEFDKLKLGLKVVVIYASGYKAAEKRSALLEEDADVYIINHGYLWKMKDKLVSKGFDYIIADELSAFKHHTAQRSRACRHIAKSIRYRIGLTGSFFTETPMDAYGEMLIIEPSLFGTNFFVFRNTYFHNLAATRGLNFPLWIPIKSRMVTMAEKLSEVCIMIKKEDCMDLPPIVYEKRTIEMSSMQRAKYKEMQKELVLTIEKLGVVATGEIILKKIMKLTEITSGFVISENGEELELGFNPKMKELAELLEGELKGKKVVVWARFTRTIELLAKKFKHLNPAIVWGGDKNMVSRAEEIDRFQSNPDCLLFIGQISLAYGFNLFASDTAIYIEHDFSSEHRIQTIGRIHRSGQKGKKVTVIDIAMADSIDTHMIESYGSKRVIADFIYSILGIKGKEARFEK